jgi:hypothetical protein
MKLIIQGVIRTKPPLNGQCTHELPHFFRGDSRLFICEEKSNVVKKLLVQELLAKLRDASVLKFSSRFALLRFSLLYPDHSGSEPMSP